MLHVKVFPSTTTRHLSQIYAGLFDLSAVNQVKLAISGDFSADLVNEFRRNVLWLEVAKTENSQAYKVCFDMRDHGTILKGGIKKADYYFKRSYQQNVVQELDESLRPKAFPFGLYYPCRSDHERICLNTMKIIYFNRKINKIHPTYSRHNRRHILGYIRYLLAPGHLVSSKSCPLTSKIVVGSDTPTEKKILFLTRLWGTHMHDQNLDMCKKINDTRVEIIKALRNAFGDKFIGGLMRNKLAEKYHPHLIFSGNTDKDSYLNYVRKSLVAVTTTGLWNSIGARLPEYIAASRCIVTEPLLNTLPTPLVEGKHLFTFNNPLECVEACKRILGNPGLAKQMRKNNEQYYARELKPAELISKRLATIV